MTGAWAAGVALKVRRLGLLLAVLLLAGQAAAGETALSGRWQGPITENGIGAAKGEARLSVDPSGNAFAARWTGVDGEMEATFQPTARPGVLAPAAGGFKSMFGSKAPEPFKGDELVWARRDEAGIHIYRLKIADDGGFALDRYAFEPRGGKVSLTVDRLGPGGIAKGGMRAELGREGG